jgi:uncharacterized membrane protein YfcA
MDFFIVCLVALIGSALTFFSGFGLGTLLLPVFGLFFPIDVAIAMTAVVHFLNNLFKLGLTGRHINWPVALRFGLPAMLAALAGSWLLTHLPDGQVLRVYQLGSRTCSITWLKLIIGLLMIVFALFEILPALKAWTVSAKWIPVGGLLSGFFGGLSGHQGALRSAFLLRLNLGKQVFIATGIAIACLIDVSRISVYASQFTQAGSLPWTLVAAATTAAFAGAWLGNRYVKKMTLKGFQFLVAAFIILFSLALMAGLV